MMKKSLSYLLLIFFLSGCTFINRPDKDKIESGILISYVYSNEIKSRNSADVEITNQTNFCLVFPLIDGIEIYTESNKARTKLVNLVTYLGDQNLIVSPKGESLSSRIITLRPDTSKIVSTMPVNFTVKLTGYLCDDKEFKIEKKIPFIAIP
ncbi:MAG: hypothetical protein RIR73_1129 [Chloroflexota bacterium]|jgi:hypothetical protein